VDSALQAGRYGAGTPFDWPVAIGYERAPLATFPAGGFQCVAGASGVAIGIFGWVATDGTVSNAQSPGGILVFVLPVLNDYNWQRVYTSYPVSSGRNYSGYPADPYQNPAQFPLRVIRAGNQVVPATIGTFRARFPGGALIGNQVWVDPVTGLPYASNVTGLYVPTHWTVMRNGRANAVLLVSSSVPPLSS